MKISQLQICTSMFGIYLFVAKGCVHSYSCHCYLLFMQCCVLSIECIYEDQGPAPENPRHLPDHRTNKRVLLVSQMSTHTSKAPPCVLRQTKPGTASAWMAASAGTANHSSGHAEITAFFHCSPKTPEVVFPVIF